MSVYKCVNKKRFEGILLSVIIGLLMFTGCSDRQEGNFSSESAKNPIVESGPIEENETVAYNKSLVYKMTKSEFGKSRDLFRIATNGKDIYFRGMIKAENSDFGELMYTFMHCTTDDPEMKLICTHPEIEKPTAGSGPIFLFSEMAVTPDGKLAVIFKTDYKGDGELILYDQTGKELWRTSFDLANGLDRAPLCTEDRIYIPVDYEILVFDYEGVQQENLTVTVPEEQQALIDWNNDGGIAGMYQTEDGRVFVSYYSTMGHGQQTFVGIDPATGEMTEIGQTWGDYEYCVGYGSEYDFILKGDEGIFGWDVGMAKESQIVSFEDSALDAESVDYLNCIDGRFLAWYRDPEGEVSLCYLTQVDPDEIPDKQIVTVGIFSTGSDPVNDITKFNQSSENYMVKVMDYTKYADAVTQLKLDLTAGKGPDVIYYENSNGKYELLLHEFGRQGFLEDLQSWFDRDATLKREDYLINIFDAGAVDGKWYQLPTSFEIHTYVGKTSVVGEEQGWTEEDMLRLGEEYPDSLVIGECREILLRNALVTRWNEFVDEEKKSCEFDSEEFIELLTWLRGYPARDEMDYSIYRKEATRSGAVLVGRARANTLGNFNVDSVRFSTPEKTEEVTYLGFPDGAGNGALINYCGVSVAINAQSECKEGAWEFIRYYLSDDYQNRLNTLPVKWTRMNAMAQKALTEIGGGKDSYDVELYPPTREMIDGWLDYICAATCADTLDNEIYNIIYEEAVAFFAGQKTAKEVADIIQSRVWIYIAE